MKSIYYAHPMSWYGTKEEQKDIDTLKSKFEIVTNPGSPVVQKEYDWYKAEHVECGAMAYFLKLVQSCDALAIRTFRDGKIGAGVAAEALSAYVAGKPIYLLAEWEGETSLYEVKLTLRTEDILTIEETRDRIKKGIM